MRHVLIALLLVVATSMAWAQTEPWPPLPDQPGSLTVQCPNSLDGAQASLWGFYQIAGGGWKNATFGTGTFFGGKATINYTIPSDFVSTLYWNVTANYSTFSDVRGQYLNYEGGWDQFFTTDPDGITVSTSVYKFDQRRVSTTSASFRASAQAGTIFPEADLIYWPLVSVRKPWTGTMAEYTAPTTGGYYANSKTSLLPTRAIENGFTITVLEGNPEAVNVFQEINLSKAGYSVDLYAYKNASGDDPLGYLYWTTLVDVQSADCLYDEETGVFSGTFAAPLETGVTYFVVPEFDVLDSVGSSTSTWIQAGRGTDLLLSGSSLQANLLALDAQEESLYVQPGEDVIIDLNVSNLAQKVNACQAFLGYSSTYFHNPTAGCVAPGGSIWDLVIWDSWTDSSGTTGEIDTAIGVDAQGSVGTDVDSRVAKVTLKAKAEGQTTVYFRPDLDPDPNLTETTILSDMNAQTVMPSKRDSQTIIIDGTAPNMGAVTATPGDWTNADEIVLTFSATDPLGGGVASGVETYEINVNGQTFVTENTSLTLDVSGYADGQYTVSVTATDKAGNESAPATTVIKVDHTDPLISITGYPTANPVLQGVYTIVVTASDATAGLDGVPVVTVSGMTVSGPVEDPTGTFTYTIVVDAATANGEHTINASVSDNAGNYSEAVQQSFTVNKNEIEGLVQLEGYVGTSRAVTFVATAGAVTKEWTVTATGHITSYTLTDVPENTTHLSAKTGWTLRTKIAVEGGENGQWTADFTGTEPVGTTRGTGNYLRGGDINDSNSVNVLDYSLLKISWGAGLDGDIDGNGSTGTVDYSIMKSNWFRVGDAR